MDPKAAAKSKRAHTISGRRAHPTGAAARRKHSNPNPSRPSYGGLPSNSSRYYDGDVSEGSKSSSAQLRPGDSPQARREGADYAFLLEEARSRQPAHDAGLFTFDDSPFEYLGGSSPTLSVKGRGIVAWSQDDNFIIENESSSSFEVPFLSMDLHALAVQLSKFKLSERLFIESSLFPEEAEEEGSKVSTVATNQSSQTAQGSCVGTREPMVAGNPVILDLINRSSGSQETTSEASAVEAELDMLLNSLAEAHISTSGGAATLARLGNSNLGELQGPSSHVQHGVPTSAVAVSSLDDGLVNLLASASSSAAEAGRMASPIDDLIDDLLAETTQHLKTGATSSSPPGQIAAESAVSLPSQSPPPGTEDDFDSWFDTLQKQ